LVLLTPPVAVAPPLPPEVFEVPPLPAEPPAAGALPPAPDVAAPPALELVPPALELVPPIGEGEPPLPPCEAPPDELPPLGAPPAVLPPLLSLLPPVPWPGDAWELQAPIARAVSAISKAVPRWDVREPVEGALGFIRMFALALCTLVASGRWAGVFRPLPTSVAAQYWYW